MVIAKFTDNLYASEVYRELERQAVRKGHFDPTEEQRVKLASQQVNQTRKINEPVNAEPSDDLVQDVARLAFAMRRKGLVNHADELENSLVLYKQAECGLYNVTPEKNMDFVHFSHRDGDVEIIEGAGELGTIETIDSLAKKIRALTEKEPTGKLPGKSAAIADIASIIKSADTLEGRKERIAKMEKEVADLERLADASPLEILASLITKEAVEADSPVGQAYTTINTQIDKFPDLSVTKVSFRGKNFLTDEGARKLYASVAGKSEQALVKAENGYKMLKDFGITTSPPDHAAFLNFIRANFNKADNIRTLAQKLGADGAPAAQGVVGQFRSSVGKGVWNSAADLKAQKPDYDVSGLAQTNPVSMWGQTISLKSVIGGGNSVSVTGWYLIPDRASAFAEQMRAKFYSNFSDPAYGAYFDDLNKADDKVKTYPGLVYRSILGTRIDLASVGDVMGEFERVDANKALAPVYQTQSSVAKILDSKDGKLAIAALDYLGQMQSAVDIRGWRQEFNAVVAKAEGSINSVAEVQSVDITPATGKIRQAISLWNDAGRASAKGSDAEKLAAQNIREMRGLLSAITGVGVTDSDKKPSDVLTPVLSQNGFSSFDDMMKQLDSYVALAQSDKDKAKG